MKYILTVEGMRCKACESLIKEDLLSTGVEDPKVAVMGGLVSFNTDNKEKVGKAKKVIEESGYKVSDIREEN
jgi:copper chaperone CopZ